MRRGMPSILDTTLPSFTTKRLRSRGFGSTGRTTAARRWVKDQNDKDFIFEGEQRPWDLFAAWRPPVWLLLSTWWQVQPRPVCGKGFRKMHPIHKKFSVRVGIRWHLNMFHNIFNFRWNQSKLLAVPQGSSHAGNLDDEDKEDQGNDYFHSGMVNVSGWTDGRMVVKV